MTMLSVLIPTTGRRPEMLAQVIAAIRSEHPAAQILTVTGLTWGAGLNYLARRRALGDYWSCSCDDTVPHPGWLDAAILMLEEGLTPASRYLHEDGSPLRPGTDDAPHRAPVDWCRSFLLTPAIYQEIGPFIDATWYADIDYSERLAASGRPITACDGYTFTHLAGERDWLDQDEEDRSRGLYERSQRERGVA